MCVSQLKTRQKGYYLKVQRDLAKREKNEIHKIYCGREIKYIF